MTAGASDPRYDALARSVFAVLPEPELRSLAGEVHESRLLAGHLLYDPEVTVAAAGLIRAFIEDDTGRQVTVTYLRPGATLALSHLAGRRYPTAFQAVEDSRLIVIGNDRAQRLHQTHAALGWATIRELAGLLDDLETGLAYFAFGQLRQPARPHRRTGRDGPAGPPGSSGDGGRQFARDGQSHARAPGRRLDSPHRLGRGHRHRPQPARDEANID
ncbi:MAG: Crp/Fnr family transcriptional regulator [Acidimicrobiales bacterium]